MALITIKDLSIDEAIDYINKVVYEDDVEFYHGLTVQINYDGYNPIYISYIDRFVPIVCIKDGGIHLPILGQMFLSTDVDHARLFTCEVNIEYNGTISMGGGYSVGVSGKLAEIGGLRKLMICHIKDGVANVLCNCILSMGTCRNTILGPLTIEKLFNTFIGIVQTIDIDESTNGYRLCVDNNTVQVIPLNGSMTTCHLDDIDHAANHTDVNDKTLIEVRNRKSTRALIKSMYGSDFYVESLVRPYDEVIARFDNEIPARPISSSSSSSSTDVMSGVFGVKLVTKYVKMRRSR